MAKNTNKKNRARNGAGTAAMDTSEGAPAASTAAEATQPMDTSDVIVLSSQSAALRSADRKIKIGVQKKEVQVKRTKNLRKMKAIAKAIAKSEQAFEKAEKAKGKKTRIQSAKSLYD